MDARTDRINSGRQRSGKLRRLGVFAPFALALVLVAAWSGGWLWLRGACLARAASLAAEVRSAGGAAAWSQLRVSGYPFYLDMDFTQARLADRAGWSLAAPRLRVESALVAPGRWLFAFPSGLTLAMPGGAGLVITGDSVHGGVDSPGSRPPEASFEADAPRLSTLAGHAPFGVARAAKLGLYVRPGRGGATAVLLDLDGGVPAPGGWLQRLSAGAPVSLRLEGVVTHAPSLAGPAVADALRAWSAAGGALEVQKLALAAGPLIVGAEGGALSVGADGRLVGALPLTLGGRPARVDFGAAGVSLGPLRLAPTPRLFRATPG